MERAMGSKADTTISYMPSHNKEQYKKKYSLETFIGKVISSKNNPVSVTIHFRRKQELSEKRLRTMHLPP